MNEEKADVKKLKATDTEAGEEEKEAQVETTKMPIKVPGRKTPVPRKGPKIQSTEKI